MSVHLHANQNLLQRFILYSEDAAEIMRVSKKNNGISEFLKVYAIQIDQVLQNISYFLLKINKKLSQQIPQSHLHVQLVLSTIQKYNPIDFFSPVKDQQKCSTALLSLQSNLKHIVQILDSIWMEKEDIASFPKLDNPRYAKVYEHIQYFQDPDRNKTEEENKFLKKMMVITNAAVLAELSQTNSFTSLLAFGVSFPRYAISYGQAQLRSQAFIRNPSIDVLSQIWNLPQNGMISRLKYIQFSLIKTHKIIHIPKDKLTSTHPESINFDENTENCITMRIISDDTISLQSETGSYCCSPSLIPEIDSIIFHVHGGGFISLSSQTTQTYTRRWAKSIGVTVISVDYSKPPEHPFPQAIQDVYAAYWFIVNKLPLVSNIKAKRIVMVGDSAGGNLVCALMGMILRNRLPSPIGMLLAYPAVCLEVKFSPSRLISFNTPILHASLLTLCLKEYLGTQLHRAQKHPLASPLYLTKQFVGQNFNNIDFPSHWPKTVILVGDSDPLFDDSLRLCERMVNSGVDVTCKVYEGLGHGFLSLQKVVSRGQEAILESIESIRGIFHRKSK